MPKSKKTGTKKFCEVLNLTGLTLLMTYITHV